MRKLTLVLLVIFCWTLSFAQVKFGLKAGINSIQIEGSSLAVTNSETNEEFNLMVREAQYGFHFGAFLRIKAGSFLVQPEVLFNSDNVDYALKDFGDKNILQSIGNERYNNLDIPLMFGLKLGPAQVMAGPVGHLHINASSDLVDEEFYEAAYEKFKMGWQAGVGINLWKFTLDVRYEGNFHKFGDHITLFNEEIAFSKNQNRVLASLGYRF